MIYEKINTIYQTLNQQPSMRQEEDAKLVAEWITSFQLFEPFKDGSELHHLIELLEPIKLKRDQIKVQEEGVEFCYVVSGSVVIEQESMNYESTRKKHRKQGIAAKDWVVRPYPGKTSVIIGKDPMSEIIVINSKRGRKFINKKLSLQWAEIAKMVQRQPLFRYLDKDTLLDIAQSARIMVHPYNTRIYSEGEEALHSYILLQGNIRIFSGNVQVTFLSPEQVFGDEEILGGKTHRQFKAICASERVKVMRIQKTEVQKALEVLTVLGKQRSVEKYVDSKNGYRKAISMNMKILMEKQKQIQRKQTPRHSLPLYKHKRQSLDYSLNANEDLDGRMMSSRWMQNLKLGQAGRAAAIRSKDISKSPGGQTLYGRKSLQSRFKSRTFGLLKLPFLTK